MFYSCFHFELVLIHFIVFCVRSMPFIISLEFLVFFFLKKKIVICLPTNQINKWTWFWENGFILVSGEVSTFLVNFSLNVDYSRFLLLLLLLPLLKYQVCACVYRILNDKNQWKKKENKIVSEAWFIWLCNIQSIVWKFFISFDCPFIIFLLFLFPSLDTIANVELHHNSSLH